MSLDFYPDQKVVCIGKLGDTDYCKIERYFNNIPDLEVGEIYTVYDAKLINENVYIQLKEVLIPNSLYWLAENFKPVEYNEMKTLRGLLAPTKQKVREDA